MSEPAQNLAVPETRTIPRLLRRAFSFPVFLGAVLAAGAAVSTTWERVPILGGKVFGEGDTWWHTAVGERILSTHTWPTKDIYSFTAPGNPWIAYEWLGDVVMATAHRLAGLQGLAALLVLLAVIFVLLQYYYAWLVCRKPLAAAVAVALLLPVDSASLTLRPQLIGYIFLLVALICLERFKQGQQRILWVLPGLFLVWANTHGSFVLGFLLLGLYWASGHVSFRWGALAATCLTQKQRRFLLWASLACLLAVLITPYGTRLAAYPVEYMLEQPVNVGHSMEWLPLNFAAPYAQAFLILLLGFFVVQVIWPISYSLETLILVVFTIGESCLHGRFLIVFSMVFAPVLAKLLGRWLPGYEPEKDHAYVNAALIAAIVGGVVGFFPTEARLQEGMKEIFPVKAVEYLRHHDVGPRLYSTDLWGSYMIWALSPRRKVFIDGRLDIYEYAGVLEDYIQIKHLTPQTRFLLRKYRFSACLVPRGEILETYLAALPDWKRVYSDDMSVIFVPDKVSE